MFVYLYVNVCVSASAIVCVHVHAFVSACLCSDLCVVYFEVFVTLTDKHGNKEHGFAKLDGASSHVVFSS